MSYLPPKVVTNDDLDKLNPEWNMKDITLITGVKSRHVAEDGQTPTDLAFICAQKLFNETQVNVDEIDFVLFNSYTPDYITPSSACLLQDKLGISKSAGALDFNIGCTGFVYGLSLANGLVVSGVAQNVLLLTADTITNKLHPKDKSTWTLFGDGAAATVISATSKDEESEIKGFEIGTDGAGFENIIIRNGGARAKREQILADYTDQYENTVNDNCFRMNGSEVFRYFIRTGPEMIGKLLEKEGLKPEDIDQVIFHQASKFIMFSVAKKSGFTEEQYYNDMETVGNTVSSTIPIAMHHAKQKGIIKKGDRLLLASFGGGFSWASTIIKY